MKKFLKISGIAVAILLALLIILPIVFQGKIAQQVKVAINENVNATVEFGSFRLSLIRNFPNLSFRLNDFSITGVDEFEGDTLVNMGSFFISVNLMSVFGDQGYEIKSIRVDNADLLLKVKKDGTANWDIAIPSEPTEVDADEDFDFKIALKRFQVRNSNIVYDDKELDFYTRLENFNHTLSGDFTADFTSIAVRNTTAERVYASFEGIPLLHGVFAEITADIDADLNKFEFTFRENELRLNDLAVNFEGVFAMPESDMVMDFTFASPHNEFRSFLSLVPAVYAKEFDGLQTSGSMAFNGFVKGIYSEESIPGFGINIDVDNGMFRYPDLPAAVTDVYVKTRIDNPGGDADLTIIDVSRFSLNMGGNPVDFRMKLRTPVSDPDIDASLKGKLDLATVKDFYPLDDGDALSGVIESDMAAKGRMSSIENERYDEFAFSGRFALQDMYYTSDAFEEGIEISSAELRFSPRYADLRNFDSRMGQSDISATGRIDNLLGFALNDEMLKGRFDVRSQLLNLNEFMGETEEPEEGEDFELAAIDIPANIDFLLQGSFDRILFGELEITQTTGNIRIADKTARLENLRMQMLDGTMVLSGSYASHNVDRPEIDFNMNISQFDIQKTFNTFNTFRVLAPIGERASGRFSAAFDLRSVLDEKLDPLLNTLSGGGRLSSNSITVENSPALVGLADNLNMDMFRQWDVRDILIFFEFKDGGVEVNPFDLNFGRGTAEVSGNHGFDQSINYLMSMAIPRAEFGGAANQALDNLVSQAAGRGLNISPAETVNLGVAFTGTVTDPRVSVSLGETAAGVRDQLQDAVRDAVQERTDEVREQAREAVDEVEGQIREDLERRAQQVVEEAERQAESIRREAKSAADAIRSEARTNAQRLEDEASGPIAKAAARRTGEQLIRSADERAEQLEKEADDRAQQLINEANRRADRIRAEEE